MDWTKITTVAAEGPYVVITGVTGAALYLRTRLKLPTPELATRAAYAMEVIRQSCDPTADGPF